MLVLEPIAASMLVAEPLVVTTVDLEIMQVYIMDQQIIQAIIPEDSQEIMPELFLVQQYRHLKKQSQLLNCG